MRRSIIFIFICLFFLLWFVKKPTELPVFLLDSTPSVITKGQFNNALILAISFEHDQLVPFIEGNKQQLTYLVTAKLLERSPSLSKTLKPLTYQVGLLGEVSAAYEEDASLLESELRRFEKTFQMKPMYFMTEDLQYSNALLKQLSQYEINALAPTKLTTFDKSLKDGQHVYITLNEQTSISFSKLSKFLQSGKFTSIEETIFNSSISTSTAP